MSESDGDAVSRIAGDQTSGSVQCSNCGAQNAPGDRYCANCGMPLQAAESRSSLPPQYARPERDVDMAGTTDDDWRMSSLGPPPPRRRRIWLWVLLGLLSLCALFCVGTVIFASTGTGQEWFNDLGTRVAEQATEQSR